jgi:methyl-accepting chemotaxis protein
MNSKSPRVRRRYFINRKFQIEFSLRFLLIIAAAAVTVLLLFFYNSRGTVTAGYTGSEVKLVQTGVYFLPSLLASTAVIVVFACLIGALVMILLSHRLAGPLFRFQAVIDELASGNLALRFNLRDKDQFKELADRINGMAGLLDWKMGEIKGQAAQIEAILERLRQTASREAPFEKILPSLNDLAQRLTELQKAAGYFRTTQQRQAGETPH